MAMNMSYCRFENTLKALEECKQALDEDGGIEGVEETASQYEKPCIKKLVALCQEIADDYGDELNGEAI